MAEQYSDRPAPAQHPAEHDGQHEPRTVAVVVTYNRRDLLPKTLAGIASGRMRPVAVVIVDNASTDDTAAYLDSLEYELPVDRITLRQNMGGAGGFAVGIDRALERHDPDLVWVMDDDTEPTENTLAEAVEAWLGYSEVPAERPAVVASRVVWTNGEDHPMNTPRTMFAAGEQRHARARAVGGRPIRSASFVSILMDAQAIRRNCGLPIAEFFIWNDDFEFSTRLIHHRDGIAVPSSVAKHHTKTFGTTNANPGPRFYNDVRNKLWVFTRSRTLNPLEKLLYGGSSARLWVSTLLRTDDRRTYLGYFLNGLRDGLRPPTPNRRVLEGIYPLTFPGRYGVPASNPEPVVTGNAGAAGCVSSAPDFSVLMSVYAKENPAYLEQALESNLLNQTLRPSELVLVLDGPLTPELRAVVDRWVARAENLDCPPIQLVELPQNVGLAEALNAGLQACSYELVARADSDDISEPTRFAELIPALAAGGYALLGSAMLEVNENNSAVESVREAIVEPKRLLRAMDSRNPIYHPSVAFRKSAVQTLGGYEYVPGAEDWWLWMRLRDAGYRLGNLPAPLVRYRVGAGAYTKRGGVDAWKQDWAIQRRLYTGHAISKARWAQNMAVRSVYRFVPEALRRNAFRALSTVAARASSTRSSSDRSTGAASEGGF